MIYILYGPENYSLHLELEKIIANFASQDAGGSNMIELEADKLSVPEFGVACNTIPFLADKRLVIMSGLLERFETKTRQVPAKKNTQKTDLPREREQFAKCITDLPKTTILVLIDKEITNKNPLLKEIAINAQVKVFPLLNRKDLIIWAQKRIVQGGGRISIPALELIVKLVGNDLWSLAGEIDKLILYTNGHNIEEKDIKAIVSHAQEANVFSMIDAIMENKIGFAEELLQQLLDHGATPTYLLWMLHRQVRLIVLSKELIAQKKSNKEIQSILGLSDYPLQKTVEQAGKYSEVMLKEFYEKLLETDLAIKTGKYEGELALNILVAELGGAGLPGR